MSSSTCGTCTDTNCKLCTVNNDIMNGTVQQCGLCKNGYYFRLKDLYVRYAMPHCFQGDINY